MAIYTIVVIAISALLVVSGLLCGMIRGLKRSILRLILVVASLVLVLLFNNTLVGSVSEITISGQTLSEKVLSLLPAEFASYEDIIMPMILSLLSVVTFILGFIILLFVSLIIYYVLCLFVKPRKDASGKKIKYPLFGMIVGAAQGLVLAIVYGVMLTGLAGNVDKISKIEMNESKLVDLEAIEQSYNINIGIDDYCNSTIAKTYDSIGGFIYDMATTIKIGDKKYTFDGQVEALTRAISLANEMNSLANVDFSGGLTDGNKQDIINILNNLDNITGEMSEEVSETLNEMVKTIASDMLQVDLSDFDLTDIKFSKVADVVENVEEVKTNPTQENVNQIVSDLIESNVIFVLIDATDMKLDEFDEESKNLIISSIDSQELTAEEEAKLKGFFGIVE